MTKRRSKPFNEFDAKHRTSDVQWWTEGTAGTAKRTARHGT
ncbi:MAG: hypothetical protein AAF598_08260 [Bacteroidota bacterium]